MKIVIAGGSGQVGHILQRALAGPGEEIVVLTRGGDSPLDGVRAVHWDGRTDGAWMREIDGADVVVNLAGRSVDCRYTEANRREILDSRVESTRAIGRAIETAQRPPHTWLQASTATIYAHSFDAPNDEHTGTIGGGEPGAPGTWRFSIDVARAWESALDEARTPSTRRVKLRSAMTMSPDRGGIFDVLLRLVRFGLGGASGSGRQYVSWIHEEDFARAIRWLIEHRELDGVVNVSSPQPLPNRDFMRALRQAWGSSFGLSAPPCMIEVGTFLLRTESELVLKSRRVVPARLMESGFRFEHPSWPEAARDLCRRWRAMHRGDERR